MAHAEATGASFGGNAGGVVQAILLLVLVAGAVFVALAVIPARVPVDSPEPAASAPAGPPSVLSVAPRPRLVVVLDSAERAAAVQAWHEVHGMPGAGAFARVEFTGPLAGPALEEMLTFATAACSHQACAPVVVLDLRASAALAGDGGP